MKKIFLFCLSIFFLLNLAGCAGHRTIAVIEDKGFQDMSRKLSSEMQKQGLMDADGSFYSRSADTGIPYGRILYRQLSPSFLTEDKVNHVYLGENFRATLTPKSRVTQTAHGFRIQHPTQRITVSMLAIADWNNDDTEEWLVSCLIEPRRGGITRTYFLLVPPPLSADEQLLATIAATYDCKGLACQLHPRTITSIPRMQNENTTPVQDVTPGRANVTEAPSSRTEEKTQGIEERSL